ncbi:hypothetical protein AAFC00_007024 [Neodothiora populina]|uniref:Uncharacterized protein n=1 Tax=Neodothiora populina TaxID=2781224 RepID=A0ABR3PD72_9PEZI
MAARSRRALSLANTWTTGEGEQADEYGRIQGELIKIFDNHYKYLDHSPRAGTAQWNVEKSAIAIKALIRRAEGNVRTILSSQGDGVSHAARITLEYYATLSISLLETLLEEAPNPSHHGDNPDSLYAFLVDSRIARAEPPFLSVLLQTMRRRLGADDMFRRIAPRTRGVLAKLDARAAPAEYMAMLRQVTG